MGFWGLGLTVGCLGWDVIYLDWDSGTWIGGHILGLGVIYLDWESYAGRATCVGTSRDCPGLGPGLSRSSRMMQVLRSSTSAASKSGPAQHESLQHVQLVHHV